ncbi:MAG: hemerythrin domain-containing protein [Armatimonadetes bacterium]|nr:hemerythrin domain-containing protein [Armatimonadota bacterium]
MPTSPFDDLNEEHRALQTDVAELKSTIRNLTGQETSSLGSGGVIRDELEMFRKKLRIHFRREEEGLFPEARRIISEGARGADVFGSFFAEEAEDDMSAHASLTSRANQMLEIAGQLEESGRPDEQTARQLLSLINLTSTLLDRHAAKEETLIFPMLEKSLTSDQVDDVQSRVQEIGSDRDLTAAGDEEEEEHLKQLGGEE